MSDATRAWAMLIGIALIPIVFYGLLWIESPIDTMARSVLVAVLAILAVASLLALNTWVIWSGLVKHGTTLMRSFGSLGFAALVTMAEIIAALSIRAQLNGL